MLTPGRRRKPRKFGYEPRYYNKEKDDELKRRMRVKRRKKNRRSPLGLLYLIGLLLLTVFIIQNLGG
jgi:hypothetical protein